MHVKRRLLEVRPVATVDAVKSAVEAITPRVTGTLTRATRGREERFERRLPLGRSLPAEARQVVDDALGGRVALPVLERAQLVVSELMSHAVLHGPAAPADVTVRVGVRGDGCRLEVETPGPAFCQASLHALCERWGFEQTAAGSTRAWAELLETDRSHGEDRATRTPVMAPAAEAVDVHVVPNARAATWEVYDAQGAQALSEHATETEAEVAAHMCARVRGRRRIVIHDRYHRTRETVF
jgi:hypothetical protein